ncbi:MAG: hypothetical protein KC766_20615 [Myxococcales bacterium]|nr:hypothetical protein [Myxococcales bacterium]
MSAFELKESMARAQQRLEREPQVKLKSRRDQGHSRLAPEIERRIAAHLLVRDKPSLSALHRKLTLFCRRHDLPPPSRATLYNAIQRVELPEVQTADLPEAVRASLYNLGKASRVPADRVVFYAFNHGAPRALSYAAGLPWLWLSRAAQLPGWRPKSLALLNAVMAYRGIS